MPSAKKIIIERQSQSDRILEQKIKKQNLVLRTMEIPAPEEDKKSGAAQPAGKK